MGLRSLLKTHIFQLEYFVWEIGKLMSSTTHKPLPPLAVVVLGLLVERPMHPYEMVQTAVARREDRLANIRAGSMYHAVGRLEAQGLIAVEGVLRAGNRPERTVYAITDDGRSAYHAAVRTMLVSPSTEYPQLYMALALAHDLPRDEAVQLIDERIAAMRAEYDELSQTASEATEAGVPEMFFLDGGCRLATLRSQIDWLADLSERLRNRTMGWLDDPGFIEDWRAAKAAGIAAQQFCAGDVEEDVP